MSAEHIYQAVCAFARDHDVRRALVELDQASTPLAKALASHLRESTPGASSSAASRSTYDASPEGFYHFVRDGGNPELYAQVSGALLEQWNELATTRSAATTLTVVDVGVGDGMALLPVLQQWDRRQPSPADSRPMIELTLIEPVAAMLEQCVAQIHKLAWQPEPVLVDSYVEQWLNLGKDETPSTGLPITSSTITSSASSTFTGTHELSPSSTAPTTSPSWSLSSCSSPSCSCSSSSPSCSSSSSSPSCSSSSSSLSPSPCLCPPPSSSSASSSHRYQLAQATFSLNAIPRERRRNTVLPGLRARVDRLLIAEFDVRVHHMDAVRLDDLLERRRVLDIVAAYERGVLEYEQSPHRQSVLHGFLCPCFWGYFAEAEKERTTNEQTASLWIADLHEAGFTRVSAVPLHPYWWSDAILFVCE